MVLTLNLHNSQNLLTNLIIGDKPIYCAYPNDWSIYFVKPASPIMYGIMELHDFIMIYLVFIVFFVTFMLAIILKESTISENNEVNKFYKVKSLYNVTFNHHTVLETIWILIPTIILLTIAIPSFVLLYAMDIIPSHNFSIKVIGHQWYWSYEYIMNNTYLSYPVTVWDINEDDRAKSTIKDVYAQEYDILHRYTFDSYMIPGDELQSNQIRLLDTTNPLVIPVAQYASITVTASDVIHSFAVPSLGIKIDAVPGRLNTVSLYIMELGHYYGQCSELCGVNHGFMPIEIYCVDLVGFSIYKAALAAKFVIKEDIDICAIDGKARWSLYTLYQDLLLEQLEYVITKRAYIKQQTAIIAYNNSYEGMLVNNINKIINYLMGTSSAEKSGIEYPLNKFQNHPLPYIQVNLACKEKIYTAASIYQEELVMKAQSVSNKIDN